MYSSTAGLSRSASASPATAMTWRVRMSPPTATVSANAKTRTALPYLLIRFLLTISTTESAVRWTREGKKRMKLREYAKTRRVMQQDVEMRTTTTTGGVNGLTPETCATDLARS